MDLKRNTLFYFYRLAPLVFELIVEATYPICETLPLSLVTISASIQSFVLIEMQQYLSVAVRNDTILPYNVSEFVNIFIFIGTKEKIMFFFCDMV